jgi:hypothetical protein
MNIAEVYSLLDRRIEEAGTAEEFARQSGLSPQFICDVRQGRRRITDRLAKALGLKRVEVFEEIR